MSQYYQIYNRYTWVLLLKTGAYIALKGKTDLGMFRILFLYELTLIFYISSI